MMAKGNNNVFFANYIAYNKCGVAVRRDYPPADSIFYNNTFLDNDVQVNTDSTYLVPTGDEVPAYHSGFFDNGPFGNYWSDYNGVDFNEDGIGDSPYVIDEDRKDNYPLMTPYLTSQLVIEYRGFNIVNVENKYGVTETWQSGIISPLFLTIEETKDWIDAGPTTTPNIPAEFPTTLLLASVLIVAIAGLGILTYFKKCKRKT